MSQNPDHLEDCELLLTAAKQAGTIAKKYFNADNQVWHKQGNSPVSEADFAVDDFLRQFLLNERPDYGWLSEETDDDSKRSQASRVFIIDPIDGTRGFIAGRKEWCVSLAIVENERPIVGVLECPAMEKTFSAARGGGARLNGVFMPDLEDGEIKSITSSQKLNAIMEKKLDGSITVHPFVPSLAYRIAMVASGQIDAAISRAGARDWDIAAADLILSECGGFLTDINGNLLRFNQAKTRHGPMLAASKIQLEQLLGLAKSGNFLQ